MSSSRRRESLRVLGTVEGPLTRRPGSGTTKWSAAAATAPSSTPGGRPDRLPHAHAAARVSEASRLRVQPYLGVRPALVDDVTGELVEGSRRRVRWWWRAPGRR